MKAIELRIGNKVDLYGSIATVQRFDFNDRPPNGLAVDKGKPIPLTEQWLKDFGFVVHNGYDWFIPGNSVYSIFLKGKYFFYPSRLRSVNTKIKYVHQLQNLYWCLCEKELQINA